MKLKGDRKKKPFEVQTVETYAVYAESAEDAKFQVLTGLVRSWKKEVGSVHQE